MKHNPVHEKTPSESLHLKPVRFEFTHPTAVCVSVAGCFNSWKPEATLLHSTGEGKWLKETVLAPGTYEYRLIVDGEWMADPLAKESVSNPFGGRNSILKVETVPEAVHSAAAQSLPFKSPPSKTPEQSKAITRQD